MSENCLAASGDLSQQSENLRERVQVFLSAVKSA
jgi:hypothetical protein